VAIPLLTSIRAVRRQALGAAAWTSRPVQLGGWARRSDLALRMRSRRLTARLIEPVVGGGFRAFQVVGVRVVRGRFEGQLPGEARSGSFSTPPTIGHQQAPVGIVSIQRGAAALRPIRRGRTAPLQQVGDRMGQVVLPLVPVDPDSGGGGAGDSQAPKFATDRKPAAA